MCGSWAAAYCHADCGAHFAADTADEPTYVATYCCANIEAHIESDLHSRQAHPNAVFLADFSAFSASIGQSYPKANRSAVGSTYASSVGRANSTAYIVCNLFG